MPWTAIAPHRKHENGSAKGFRARVLLLLPLLVCQVVPLLGVASASAPGQWTSTTPYPIPVAGDSCVTYSTYVYCIGGFDANGRDYNDVYYAELSPSGIGNWSVATPYPAKVDSAACFAEDSTLYCLGGENSSAVFNQIYDAPISSSGLGQWSSAGTYPSTIASASCVADSGYVYCVGGFNLKGEGSASTYYASISSGIGPWMSTTPYPVDVYTTPCVVQADYLYCIAGQEENLVGGTGPINNSPTNGVFYAPLSPSGIGSWQASTAYVDPRSSASCVSISGQVYCLGGYGTNQLSNDTVFSSPASESGVGSWTESTPYPVPFDLSSCVSAFSSIYCIAGRSYGTNGMSVTSADYYITLPASASTTSTTTSLAATTTSGSTAGKSTTPNAATLTASPSHSTSNTTMPTASSTSTTPEFPNALAAPLILALVLLLVALLTSGRKPLPAL